MLSLRQRGKARIFYVRGSVTLGIKVIVVPERSSGTSDRSAAEFFKNQLENQLKEELMFGKRAAVSRVTIADAFETYLNKPGGVNSSDTLRIDKLNELIGDWSLAEPAEAWNMFQAELLTGHAPGGQDRYRSILQSAVNYYLGKHNLSKIKIPAVKFNNERVRFLELHDRDRLIASYTPHVQPIIKVLAYQGPRVQEALQLQWGIDGVDLRRQRIYIGRTKQGKPLTAPMHPLIFDMLHAMWVDRGKPHSGHVFLNRLGKPYTDTRTLAIQGGNPLKSAHKTALKRSGIVDFTIHDWRHHWASHCVMAGIDLESLRQLGGWASLKMVQRYAAVSSEHLRGAIGKLQ